MTKRRTRAARNTEGHRGIAPWSVVVACALLLSACGNGSADTNDAAPEQQANPPPERVLFVGNSFTSWNGGQWAWFEALSAARADEEKAIADRVAFDGFTLERHWNSMVAPEVIAMGDYDAVILQGDIPETTVGSFLEYSALFDEAAREAGARPILFMAWAYERLGWISQEEIAAAHAETRQRTGAEIAPVGLAWDRARSERPEADLFDADQEHPSELGSYLAALVIYATVYGESPEGLQFVPPRARGISSGEDAWLRRIAWEVFRSGI